ncbi:hypothetical protein [Shewanella canadensis]|uniref:hypothetical protein n=1 Tax=Shewanella canadensis TaxID=271096 RepID=UPI00163AB9C5|nr:hypothetical protein [Shewanella canadensis]
MKQRNSRSNRIIFTLAIGDNPMHKAAVASFKEYGKRVDADIIVTPWARDKVHH